jgi:hypothetical protein
VKLTIKSKRETRVFTARVNWTEPRGEGLYFGYTPDSREHGAWGCSMLLPTPTPFGLVALEVLS